MSVYMTPHWSKASARAKVSAFAAQRCRQRLTMMTRRGGTLQEPNVWHVVAPAGTTLCMSARAGICTIPAAATAHVTAIRHGEALGVLSKLDTCMPGSLPYKYEQFRWPQFCFGCVSGASTGMSRWHLPGLMPQPAFQADPTMNLTCISCWSFSFMLSCHTSEGGGGGGQSARAGALWITAHLEEHGSQGTNHCS